MISLLAMGVPIIGGTSFRQFCSLTLNILSSPDLRLRHLAADQKKRPILILHRDGQPLEHDT